MNTTAPLRIIQFTAENVKRLKAIDITPDPHMQVIAGRNAQGKSSVLDAIKWALGGVSAQKGSTRPVRDGEDSAFVCLDLDALRVTRTWSKAGTSQLMLESKDGAKFSAPQATLDTLVGKLSFDPLEFARLKGKEQRAALLDLVDLDLNLDELDQKRADLFGERTQVGRDAKALGSIEVDDDLPAEEQSAAELVRMIQARQERNGEIRDAIRAVEQRQANVKRITDEIQRLQAALADEREAQKKDQERVKFLGNQQDTDDLEEQLASVEETNAAIRANNTARQRKTEQDKLNATYADLTKKITKIDATKDKALAGARFPIEGLGIEPDGVTYQGVPFAQASSAEQIRVSTAMAMALNPRLRIIRISDGSLLDDENLEAIREMAVNGEYQLWIERVGDGGKSAIIIEDGEVAK